MYFEIKTFPIYGITVGFQYVSGTIEAFDEPEDYRAVQLFGFLFGLEIGWYVTPQD